MERDVGPFSPTCARTAVPLFDACFVVFLEVKLYEQFEMQTKYHFAFELALGGELLEVLG